MSAAGHRADRGGDGLVHRRRRLCAGDERRERSSCAGQGTIFLGGPPLVKAATGEIVWPRSWAAPTCTRASRASSTITPHNDAHALAHRAARIVAGSEHGEARRRWRCASRSRRVTTRRSSTASSRPICARPYDVREVIARIVDGCEFDEFKRAVRHDAGLRLRAHLGLSGRHRRQQRHPVLESRAEGRALHRTVLPARIPLVFLQNITGFMVGRKYEAGGIAKDGAKMVTAVATAAVPKFTVIIGGSFGAGNYGMCGRAYSPRFLWMWPNARISVMGGEQAASVLAHGRATAGSARQAGRRRRRKRSRRRSASSTKRRAIRITPRARLWDDGVIDPGRHATRAGPRALGGAERADRDDAVRRVPDVNARCSARSSDRQPRRDRLPHHRAPRGAWASARRGLFRRRCATRCTSRLPTRRVRSARRRRARAISPSHAIIDAAQRSRRRGDPSGLRLPVGERRLRRGLRRRRHRVHRTAGRGDPRDGLEVGGQGADGDVRRAAGARLSRRTTRTPTFLADAGGRASAIRC